MIQGRNSCLWIPNDGHSPTEKGLHWVLFLNCWINSCRLNVRIMYSFLGRCLWWIQVNRRHNRQFLGGLLQTIVICRLIKLWFWFYHYHDQLFGGCVYCWSSKENLCTHLFAFWCIFKPRIKCKHCLLSAPSPICITTIAVLSASITNIIINANILLVRHFASSQSLNHRLVFDLTTGGPCFDESLVQHSDT